MNYRIKYLSGLVAFSLTCKAQSSLISQHVTVKIYPYEQEHQMRAAAMPVLKDDSELNSYGRRFDYLLINIPEIHLREKFKERDEIGKLYPDTVRIKKRYMDKYVSDKKLAGYFEETAKAINHPGAAGKTSFTEDELMEVASKFFYCDEVKPDTTVQSHVCVGLNGMSDIKWKKDYTLLAAFCYEAIFNDFDKDTSGLMESYDAEKKEACRMYRGRITSLGQYLQDVKLGLFERMRHDGILKSVLLAYYSLNKANLPFEIASRPSH